MHAFNKKSSNSISTSWLLSYENAIWKPIPTFPIGKELKQQISSLKRKQMVSPFSLEGDGGGFLIFQEGECWCPLKEDVKVDDGFGKLAF